MKIIVDNMPKEPKECLFSHITYQGNYVCGLQGGCMSCIDTQKCNILKPISDYCKED